MKFRTFSYLHLFITLLLCFKSSANPIDAIGITDTSLLKTHLIAITQTSGYRNHKNTVVLNQVAAYIYQVFNQYADTTYYQSYQTDDGQTYKNVIARFGSKEQSTIVVGAHYDVCGNQEGADDNASGVVGLLELARLLHHKPLNHSIELVAYTLEEPPYFRTDFMGSSVHAKSLIDEKRNIYGMVSVEMIGYFDEHKKTQDYPVGILSWIYGTKGDYITLVNKFGKGTFARRFTKAYAQTKCIKTKKFKGPKWLQGIDFSDHLNYWKYGISALMLTDTSFYRNKNYHEITDTLNTLNLPKMAQVVNGLYFTILGLK